MGWGSTSIVNRERYLRPKWGRFVSQDPIGLRGGDNLFGSVPGDPVSRVDPSGKFFFVAAMGWSAAAAAADAVVAGGRQHGG